MKKYHVILSSHSPRRRELLAALDVPFTVEVGPDAPERYDESMPQGEIPQFLSLGKSKAFHRPLAAAEALLPADTLVMLQDRILGKPVDRDAALEMLRCLSGRTHTVLTGVTLRTNRKIRSFTDVTEVDVAPLTEAEIAYYVDRYRPYDKAGAYGVQEWFGHACITGIRGSYFNVMGLPVHRVYEALKEICR